MKHDMKHILQLIQSKNYTIITAIERLVARMNEWDFAFVVSFDDHLIIIDITLVHVDFDFLLICGNTA